MCQNWRLFPASRSSRMASSFRSRFPMAHVTFFGTYDDMRFCVCMGTGLCVFTVSHCVCVCCAKTRVHFIIVSFVCVWECLRCVYKKIKNYAALCLQENNAMVPVGWFFGSILLLLRLVGLILGRLSISQRLAVECVALPYSVCCWNEKRSVNYYLLM